MTNQAAEPRTELNITDVVSGPIPPRVMNLTWPNKLHTRIADVVAQKGPPPWSVRLIADERNLVTLIANPPGTGNRPHWHKDFDEWWFILAGQLQWELTGGTVIEAGKDAEWTTYEHDVHGFVYVERNSRGVYDPDPVQIQAVKDSIAFFDARMKNF